MRTRNADDTPEDFFLRTSDMVAAGRDRAWNRGADGSGPRTAGFE